MGLVTRGNRRTGLVYLLPMSMFTPSSHCSSPIVNSLCRGCTVPAFPCVALAVACPETFWVSAAFDEIRKERFLPYFVLPYSRASKPSTSTTASWRASSPDVPHRGAGDYNIQSWQVTSTGCHSHTLSPFEIPRFPFVGGPLAANSGRLETTRPPRANHLDRPHI